MSQTQVERLFIADKTSLMVDMWRLHTNITIASQQTTDITANLERVDSDGFALLGTGMSESSGIFTFPSTGFYKITANGYWFRNASASGFNGINIYTTTDNSTYNAAAFAFQSVPDSANYYSATTAHFFLDVTNTTNVKVKFAHQTQSTCILGGSSDDNRTYFLFEKMGDT